MSQLELFGLGTEISRNAATAIYLSGISQIHNHRYQTSVLNPLRFVFY